MPVFVFPLVTDKSRCPLLEISTAAGGLVGSEQGVSCSLVKLLASASLVNQQLARGELLPVGSLVPPEPVHYLLSTVQIHEAEGPCRGSRTLLKETATEL